jgi:AcrR family transcriptional regulator
LITTVFASGKASVSIAVLVDFYSTTEGTLSVKRVKAVSIRGGARVGAGRPRLIEKDGAILAACLGLLEREGFGRLSMDDVAEAAGVTKATVYRRWPSKAALVVAATSPLYRHSLELPDTGNLRDDLLIMVENTRTLMTGRSGRILKSLTHEMDQHAELSEMVHEEIHRRRRLYHQVLNRALARGEIRPDVDHELVTELMMGPFWLRTLILPSPISREIVPQIVDAVLSGIRSA